MRRDVNPDTVILAVAKAIQATFDRGKWLELALITGTRDVVLQHPRLLRSLDWGDSDYYGHVIDMVPRLLADQARQHPPNPIDSGPRFPNFQLVEQYLNLPDWLRKSEPDLYAKLYGGPVPMDDLQSAASMLGLTDVDEHAARIRHGLHDDNPTQAIGSAKELLETVLKAILGLHGTGKQTKLDMPELLKKVNVQLGLDAAGVRAGDPGADQRRKTLGALGNLVNSTAELRNAGLGTGHGVSQRPQLDVATARLAVSAAVAAATFYIEAHAAAGGQQVGRGGP